MNESHYKIFFYFSTIKKNISAYLLMFYLFPLYFKLKQIAEQFEMHKNIVDQQRRSFNEKRIEIQPDELMIVVDFKENIRLGGGPEECGQDYFTRQQC